ncbi:hypothetical protein DH2020_014030 [Rehmannia glutinosa]|uniref:J domain-containing protein n=1 Tax=Rehmannia glutinosa TaxID=99300 RepID=A0ABR0WZ75_REHGL
MDHYKVLGVHKNASKDEIKQAFRELAMKFHPDKHSQSSEHLRDSATHKFKQLSEAYETLTDDRKRAEYNLKRNAYGYGAHQSKNYNYNYGRGGGGAGYTYSNPYGYGYSESARRSGGDGIFTKFEIGLRYLTTKSFLLNATFVGERDQKGGHPVLDEACFEAFSGMYIIDASGKALWEMRNPGKSFEEAIESVEKAKARKDNN